MTQIKANGHARANGNGNGHGHDEHARPHPQTTFAETSIEPSSFFGKLRKLYSEKVLKTQLEQLKHQGSYDAFKLGWHPAYEVRRLEGGKTRVSAYSLSVCPIELLTGETGRWDSPKFVLGVGRREMVSNPFRIEMLELQELIKQD